ncbi:hypothetical protein U91I_03174 [alpha proteobacterium U9-1i]|nr:hypothetical protein U91I_03174 [alpha proteobacterium U9-1i]
MALEGIEPPEPRKTGHRWLDVVVALLALFMSVLSIFVAQHTSQTMERLVHANSWPFLQLGSGNSNDERVAELVFGVSNVGTGPARIHSFDVIIDGRPISRERNMTYGIIEACCSEEFEAAVARSGGDRLAAVGYDLTSPASQIFLASNEEVAPMRWTRSEINHELWTAVDMARQTGRIQMRACYCSVFDECWIAETNVFPPTPVASCEPGAPPRDAGAGH